MEIPHLLLIGCILGLAGMAQSVAGFGFALFATPLLLLCGLELPQAITLVVTCSLCQSLLGIHHLRRDIPWRSSLTATAVRFVGLCAGLMLLNILVQLNPEIIRTVVGAVLCLIVAVQMTFRPRPRQHLHPAWGGAAFLSSGLLSGICGMGGPPLVLWSMAQPWPSRKVRAFLFGTFATSLPIQIVVLILNFGTPILRFSGLGLLLFPFVWLGSVTGLPLGNRLDKIRLQRFAYVILLGMGVTSLSPLLRFL